MRVRKGVAISLIVYTSPVSNDEYQVSSIKYLILNLER